MKVWLRKNLEPLIVFGLCFLAYVPTFLWMKIRWFARDSYYSHGFLIPFVVIFLIWQKREALAKLTPSSHRLGIPLIITGLAIHLLSSILRVYFTSGFSFLITLVGIILYFYGLTILKAIAFPIFFLVFAIPLPEVAIVNISFRMKMFAAKLAANFIESMGIRVEQNGSILQMRHAYVVVDDVCSGLRSLITLAALGSLSAYYLRARLWKRITLFLSIIPIAIISNVFRVIFLSLVAEIWGHEAVNGIIHDVSGLSIFVVAIILLMIVSQLLE